MCGRFVRSFTVEELIEELNIAVPSIAVVNHVNHELEPSFNLPPTVQIPVVVEVGDQLIIEEARWGFDLGAKSQLVINARSESVSDKPMFRHLLGARRCAVPMDGFFEWHRDGARKTPFYVHRADSQRMWVAGLWREVGEQHKQVVLMTHESEGVLRDVHHRSPCQLSVNVVVDWTMENVAPLDLLQPGAGPALVIHKVSSDVNSIRNNRPDLINEIDDDDPSSQMSLFE